MLGLVINRPVIVFEDCGAEGTEVDGKQAVCGLPPGGRRAMGHPLATGGLRKEKSQPRGLGVPQLKYSE